MVTLMRNLKFLLLSLNLIIARIDTARADMLFLGDTTQSTPTTGDTYLSFAGATFTDLVPIGASPHNLDLGVFTLAACAFQPGGCTEYFGAQDHLTDFALTFSFLFPTVSVSPVLFGADVFGFVIRSGNSNHLNNGSFLAIDFDNTAHHLNYTDGDGGGSFDLFVNDPEVWDASSDFGSRTVTGQIANLTYAPSTKDGPRGPVSAVPEPGSILLFGTVLAITGFWLRRRRS
jgi:PEP-CTERM motif